MSCAIIPFDEIGCLNINLVAGLKKDVPMSFTVTVETTTTPLDLSVYSGIKMNVYNLNGTSLVPALSKSIGAGIVLPTTTQLIIEFRSETLNLPNEYYYNLELERTGLPSEFFVQGYIKIKNIRDFVKKTITTSI